MEFAGICQGSRVYTGSLFTSVPCLEELSRRGIAGTGTLRQSRLDNIPIISKKDLEREDVAQGTSESVYTNDLVLTGWKDDKAVYVISNKHSAEIKNTRVRYNGTEKRSVPVPHSVHQYNKNKGGCDLLETMVALYRVTYLSKKWWWPFYTWFLNVCTVQGWRLRMLMSGKKEPYLNYVRELVIEMMTRHGTPYT